MSRHLKLYSGSTNQLARQAERNLSEWLGTHRVQKFDSTGMSDGSGSMAYKYDSRGRLIQETRTITGDSSYITSYTYDSADRQLTVTYPGGEVVTNGYNGRGLPYSLTTSADPSNPIVASVLYNNLAMPTETNLGNNLLKTTYGYWGMEQSGGYYGKLYSIKTVKTSQPDPSHQEVRHTPYLIRGRLWDAIGNLTKRENVAGAETEDFGYDFLDRLTSATNYFIFGNTGGSPNTVNSPSKAAGDSSGNIQVADAGNYRVAKYDAKGVYQSSFGSQGTGDGQFNALAGITIDTSGNIYTTEWLGTYRVQKFNSSGSYLLQWGTYGSGNGQFNQPQDIVFNSGNNYLYVADKNNHRVQYFDSSGNYQGQWGSYGTANGQFNGPWGIGVDSSGNIYVADSGNHRIQKFTATGTHLATWGSYGTGNGQFNYPRDVAVDSNGNVWVMDTYNHRVQKLDSNGNFLMTFGSNGSGPVQFAYPRGIAVTSSKVYVVDTNNSRLQAFDISAHPNSSWAYNQIGNMTNNNGVSYTYGSKPHAVTAAGSKSYAYDSNGSMTTWDTKTLTWDVENRLTSVTGGVSYVYDGNGFRVKKVEGGVTTYYINKYYQKTGVNGIVRYYYLGDKLVAYHDANEGLMLFVHQDHLTGSSLTTESLYATVTGSIKYKPYGETRSTSGSLPAQKFTGQRVDDVGPYYYASKSPGGGVKVSPATDPLTMTSLWAGRYYDPVLGRFLQPDTIVPGRSNPQALNRYSYVMNNPQKYVDDDGHLFGIFAPVVLGAALGAAFSTLSYAIQVANDPGKKFTAGGLGQAIASGAVAGAVTGAMLVPGLNYTVAGLVSMGGGGLGYLAGEATQGLVNQLTGNADESTTSLTGAAFAMAGAGLGFFGGQAASGLVKGFAAPWGQKLMTVVDSVFKIEKDPIEIGLVSGAVGGATEWVVDRLSAAQDR